MVIIMMDCNLTAAKLFGGAYKFIEAYHAALQPICRDSGLPPMAVDILMFLANNPEHNTARDICRCRGLKPGIVSVHIERLVNEGLLKRKSVSGDRRKTQLICTEKAADIISKGRRQQKLFAQKLTVGLSEDDIKVFHNCLAVLRDNVDEISKNGIQAETEEKL